MKFRTLAVHAGHSPAEHLGAVMTPIYQTSTFAFQGVNRPGPFDYSRSGNPTRKALETCLAALEGGTAGFAFATGMAAETTVLMLFRAGRPHHRPLRSLRRNPPAAGIRVPRDRRRVGCMWTCAISDALEDALKPGAQAVWMESPTNPLMNLVDLEAVSSLAHRHGALTICDNTFLSPYFQRPFEFGVDIVVHSTTKYINGHSDVVGGAVIVVRSRGIGRTNRLPPERHGNLRRSAGLLPRAARHQDPGAPHGGAQSQRARRRALAGGAPEGGRASCIRASNPIRSTIWPFARCAATAGRSPSASTGGQPAVFRLLESVQLFTLAESLGGVESLIEHPVTMTHASVPSESLAAMGITPDLVRISVGLEDIDDLISDLDSALKTVS